MASKFFTKTGEENFINTLIKNGLNIDIPKYYILRLAINKSFRLKYYPLDNGVWSKTITHDGSGKNEKEYNYEQLIGLGKNSKNDYANILRAMFAFRHKDENLDFSDDSVFENAVEKYIHRGLLEIYNTYKSSDDFYQWLIDDFELTNLTISPEPERQIGSEIDEEELLNYFKKDNLDIEILEIQNAIRYNAYKIHINADKDYKKLKADLSNFKHKFGLSGEAIFEEASGEAMNFYIYLPKLEQNWQKLNGTDFKADLAKLDKKYEISAYCGRDMKNRPFFFNLVDAPHIFVVGTSGSGKSVLLKNLIVSIAKLNQNVEFVLIDPKGGAEFGIYENLVNLSETCEKKIIKDSNEANSFIEKIVGEMEARYAFLGENKVAKNSELSKPLNNIVIVVDELSDLLASDKDVQKSIERLAQKGRAAGIFLILATQTPNSQIFSQSLRSNVLTRITLKTTTSAQSKVGMDEVGAENLLGRGDLYMKLSGGEKVLLFAPFLSNSEVKEILS